MHERVTPASSIHRVLPVLITVLAACDAVLHLALDAVLFRGNFFGRLGPPPGAPAGPPPGGPRPAPLVPIPLPLNQMFVLNFVGYLVLIGLFWFVARRFGNGRWWVDVLFVVFVLATFLGWVEVGGPNPQGLGYLSKGIELVLMVALLSHLWLLLRPGARSLATS